MTFLCSFTINYVTTEYKFFFLCSKLSLKNISPRKIFEVLVLYSRNLFPITLDLICKKTMGGVNQCHIFVEGLCISHGIAFTYTKLIDFYSLGILTVLFKCTAVLN